MSHSNCAAGSYIHTCKGYSGNLAARTHGRINKKQPQPLRTIFQGLLGGQHHAFGNYTHEFGWLQVGSKNNFLADQFLWDIGLGNPSHHCALLRSAQGKLQQTIRFLHPLGCVNLRDSQLQSLELSKFDQAALCYHSLFAILCRSRRFLLLFHTGKKLGHLI